MVGRYEHGAPPPPDSRAAAFERTRRYLDHYATPANYTILARLTAFAEQRGHTLADLAIAWLLAEPAVATVITGASSPEQIAANTRAASWELDEVELSQVQAILEEAA